MLALLAPLAATLPALSLSFLAAFLAANIPAIVAGRGTFRRRCTVLGDHRNWVVEGVGGVAWLAAGAVLLVSLVSRVLVYVGGTRIGGVAFRVVIVVFLVVVGVAGVVFLVCVVLIGVFDAMALIRDAYRDAYRRTIRENALNALESIAGILICVALLFIVSLFNPYILIPSIFLLFVIICSTLYWAVLMYGLARYYVLLLLGPRWCAYLLLRPPVGDISPDAWVDAFKKADAYAQAYLLRTTDAKSLGVSPEEFLTILRQCERKVQPTPASSIYWQKCQEYYETVKQEREGRLQRQEAEQAAPDQGASD